MLSSVDQSPISLHFFLFFYLEVSTDFDLEFSRSLGRGTSVVENRQEMKAFTVAFWMKVDDSEIDPGTPISYAVSIGGNLLPYKTNYNQEFPRSPTSIKMVSFVHLTESLWVFFFGVFRQ